MIWLRFIWWVVWRGAVVGALFGTFISPIAATIYGAFLGAILGYILGIINLTALIVMRRIFFYLAYDQLGFIGSGIILAIVFDLIIVLICGGFLGETGMIAAVIIAAIQIVDIASRNPPANVLS
jgi:hypothetical protein